MNPNYQPEAEHEHRRPAGVFDNGKIDHLPLLQSHLIDDLFNKDKGLPPLEQHVDQTWQELEKLSREPDDEDREPIQ